jgi:hypothetical protein
MLGLLKALRLFEPLGRDRHFAKSGDQRSIVVAPKIIRRRFLS